MRIRFFPLLALLTATAVPAFAEAQTAPPGSSVAAPSAPVGDVVNKVQAFYNTSNTFKSDFSQKFWVKAYNKEKSSSGTVTFSKPGKMDWVYSNPQGNRVVSDGSVLKVYEAENKQMFEQTVDKSQYPAALSFLTGTGKLADAFDFELFAGEQMKFPGG